MTDKKTDWVFVSEQLQALGWNLLSGRFCSESIWQHDLIERRFTIYEAAFCHNVATSSAEKEKNIGLEFPMNVNALRLLADGWSIDISGLDDNCGIFIYDKVMWWGQNRVGGKRFTFSEAEQSVIDRTDLDDYFSEYKKQTESRNIYPFAEMPYEYIDKPQVEEERQPQISFRKGFVVDGIDEETLQRAIFALLGRDSRKDLIALRDKIQALSAASREAEESINRLLFTAGFSLDEKAD